MAQPQVPVFQPTSVSIISLQEWNDFRDEVTLYEQHVIPAIQALDPNAHIEGEPGQYTMNPTNPTARWSAAAQATAWLYRLQAQQLGLQAAATLAVAQAAAVPLPGAPVQPNMAAMMQQFIQALQGAIPAPAPAPALAPQRHNRIKPDMPDKFEGSATKASIFLAQCRNYFVLSPMNDEQQIWFALGLMRGGAQQWMEYQLELIGQVPQPAHFATWDTFVVEFNERFEDPHARKKAQNRLFNGDIKQTTSARVFIDELKEAFIKGGVLDDFTKFTLCERGLKEEVIRGMANDESRTFADLCRAAIQTDERLQGLKTRNSPKKQDKKGNTASTSKTQGEQVDNTKYKLTDAEKKEHTDGNLCFKCHQKGHGSRECKNPRTVYSEVKKKTPVAKVEAKEKSKGKEKTTKAKIDEVKAKDESDTAADADCESEDFSDGN